MTKRPRRRHSGRSLSQTGAGDQYLLDAFSELDLRRQVYKNELTAALSSIDASMLELSDWGRIVDYRYSDQPLSAAGSLKRGGRFNIGNDCDHCSAARFAALYLAEDHATAMREKFGAGNKSSGLSGSDLALRNANSYSFLRITGRIEHAFPLSRLASLKPFTDVIRDFKLPQEVVELARRIGLNTPQTVGSPKVLQRTLLAPE